MTPRLDVHRGHHRIEAALGGLYAGVYDGIEKDSTYASVLAAKEAAQAVNADLLIAVGGPPLATGRIPASRPTTRKAKWRST